MSELQQRIFDLEARLDRLVRTQVDFQVEVTAIRAELSRLRSVSSPDTSTGAAKVDRPAAEPHRLNEPVRQTDRVLATSKLPSEYEQTPFSSWTATDSRSSGHRTEDPISEFFNRHTESARANLEKFIGENLISKVGILILILGVGIGTKYAIDNDLISPLARIVAGYVLGLSLFGFAFRLKPKYHNFSALLLSGSVAIAYFVTYFAHSAYQLIGQGTAFSVMVLLTVGTVISAVIYDRQVIAHIGLVGAYAVPFLLSSDSGRYAFLFTYMTVINAGILALAIRKYWKALFYTASVFTWLIFGAWFAGRYSHAEHFYLALVFAAVFFALFYATKIIHGVVHPGKTGTEDLASIIATGFIFYSFCLAIGNVRTGIADYVVFFAYLAVLGLAILVTSWRFYGRYLVYLACPFTWLIYGQWFLNYYDNSQHLVLAATGAVVFFVIFYGAALVYRLITDETSLVENAGLVLTNSFIFYGFGYSIMDGRSELSGFAGLFTIGHASFHSLVSHIVSRLKPRADDVVQVLTILVLTFSTVAVPVQFDGNVITMIWSVEGALLFIFGRKRKIELFEYASYALMVMASVSMLIDWSAAPMRTPLANGELVTSLVFVAGFVAIFVANRKFGDDPLIGDDGARILSYFVGTAAMFALYNAFRLEIDNYFQLRMLNSVATADLSRFNSIWQLNYTMSYLVALFLFNTRRERSAILGVAGIGLSLVALFVFVTAAMFFFYELRVSHGAAESTGDPMNIAIRHISYVFAAVLLLSLFAYSRSYMVRRTVSQSVAGLAFDAVFTVTLFIAASCELVNLMAQFAIADGTKLGLSILWGVYALGMIAVGIARDKKHLRIAAIALLAVTLGKLFLYDVSDLPTIPKTILFVSLGTLLLTISFLYNKYKNVIFAPAETEGNAQS